MSAITFKAFPAVGGWNVYAEQDGQSFGVGFGLISPEPTIKWCEDHLPDVEQAIAKAREAK